MINISFKSVTDEIFALTALHSRMLDPIGSPVTEILCRDQLPALRVMVKAAYSQIASRLLNYIDRCDIDEGVADNHTDDNTGKDADDGTPDASPGGAGRYDASCGPSMALDFGSYGARLSAGSLMALRHYLEHLCALTVMATVCRPYAPAGADTWERSLTSVFTAVSDLLTAPDAAAPGAIRPTFL